MTAPVLPVQWLLDGRTLTGYDAQSCRWITQRVRGWRGAAKPRTNRGARNLADGAWRGDAYRDERVITLDGTCRCPTPAARADAEERLAQWIPSGTGLVRLQRTGENGLPQLRYVELDDATDAIPKGPQWFDWSFQLAAPDPRKFTPAWSSATASVSSPSSGGVAVGASGVTSHSGGGVPAGVAGTSSVATVVATGTVDNPLVFEIEGPVNGGASGGIVITDTTAGAAVLRYRGNLGAGESVFINADDADAYDVPGASGGIPGHGALLGTSSARSAVVVLGYWPTLPAGGSATYTLSGDVGTGAGLTVHSRGAWD